MTDILKHLIELIKDKTTSLGFKTALFFSIIGVIFLADNIIGFSYNYHLNNKLDQLEDIQSMKLTYKDDIVILNKILSLEKEILNRKHYSEILSNAFVIDSNDNKIIVKSNERSIYWMVLSSNYALIVSFLVLLYLPLRGPIHRTGANLLGWFAMLVILGFIMTFLTWLAYVIPLLWGKPYLNYILNTILHIPIAYFIYWFLKGK
ncbi:MAG: hypothetical protein KTR22_08765 [Flavobacteriaceae bacterium]|nr:hypothetical protein [Flavobacteriaceae bacterium]